MNTDVRSFFEKDYYGSWDIPESGELTLTILRCTQGELQIPGEKKKKRKPVISVKESDKKIALNATNTKTLIGLYGNFVEAWPGKRLTLYKSRTRNPDGSGDCDCLRIRPKVPAGSKESAATQVSRSSQTSAITASADQRSELRAEIAEPAPAADLITPDQIAAIELRCADHGIDLARLKKAAKVEALAEITAARFDGALAWIDKQIDAMETT